MSRKLDRLDQSALRLSFNDFSTLVNRYPQSQYSEDSRARMATLRNAMARHELNTAEYYFGRSAMVATINRVTAMLETYPESSYTADGLALLARAHLALGNRELAAQTVKTLKLEQPDHPDLRVLGAVQG